MKTLLMRGLSLSEYDRITEIMVIMTHESLAVWPEIYNLEINNVYDFEKSNYYRKINSGILLFNITVLFYDN